MFRHPTRYMAAVTAALLLFTSLTAAQQAENLKLAQRPRPAGQPQARATPGVELDRAQAFLRSLPPAARLAERQKAQQASPRARRRQKQDVAAALERAKRAAISTVTPRDFGTGSGDIFEREPNDIFAQPVALPVNISGEISVDEDVDAFAFQAFAGQQVNVEAFAARLRGSDLIPVIALFDADGDLLDFETGDEFEDPVLRFTPAQDQVLIASITDADDLGGRDFDYLLNLTMGVDVNEVEPNDSLSQPLPRLAATIFGTIRTRSDVDFYSFQASAGTTLIVDVDAEVIGSSLDSIINLQDPVSGVEFFFNDQADGDDSRFNIVLPYTGRYVIGIGSFNEASRGFYRLNASLVPGSGAPVLTGFTRLSKKLIEVQGAGFNAGTVVEVNGRRRKTQVINSGTLRAKVKARAGDVITVAKSPDDRRSNPLIVQ